MKAYETENYAIANYLIKMQDGKEVYDCTFMWNGDDKELRDGSFNLKD